jgi:hypothetical protein
MVSRSWTHWATSRDLTGLMVPAHDAGTGLAGRNLGETQRGGPFVLDPFDAYSSGLLSNPNVIVAGSIGAGKSTVVKMMLDRALERGRRAVILDPKGEYAPLAHSYGVDGGRARSRRLVQPISDERPRESRSVTRARRQCPGCRAEERSALRHR